MSVPHGVEGRAESALGTRRGDHHFLPPRTRWGVWWKHLEEFGSYWKHLEETAAADESGGSGTQRALAKANDQIQCVQK